MIIFKRDRRSPGRPGVVEGRGPKPMDTRRAWQKASGAACLAACLTFAQQSKAVEFGFSQYYLGLTIPMSGYVPPPGVYFLNTFLLESASRQGVTYNFVNDIAQIGYYLDADVLGGTFGVFATVPFVGDENSFQIPHSTFRTTADVASISDTDYSAVLGWHAGDNNWSLVLTGFAPTGNFIPNRPAQSGLNRPALDIRGAYTFLSQQTGTEVTGALGLTINALNTATNYQSGAELHFEWALNQHFPIGVGAGVGGYFYQQVTSDSGSGDTLGSFKGRVAAVGPLLSYAFKAGAQEVDVSARWFHEFAAENRPHGDLIYATLAFRL
jgi:hypothetical protein